MKPAVPIAGFSRRVVAARRCWSRFAPLGLALPCIVIASLSAAALGSRDSSPSKLQAEAARALLAALDEAQRKLATAEFDARARTDWHFVPREREGIALGELKDAQALAARRLIASGLSNQGALALEGILQLEQVLLDLDRARGVESSIRDPKLYHLLVCGEPGSATWSWRIEGHHVSIHFTHVDGRACATPLFLGANPAVVRGGPHAGLRVLGAKEDLARALAQSLTIDQRGRAGTPDVPADILYQPNVVDAPTEVRGLPATELSSEQRAQLVELHALHARDLRPELADVEIARLRAELERARFVWHGALEAGKACYYALEWPGAAIEYVNVQNDANHAHCVWRDFARDLGRDPLREHLRAEHGGGGPGK